MFSGHVYDGADGRALAGAQVVSSQGARTLTDEQGYFELDARLPAAPATDREALPATMALSISAPGHRGERLLGLPLLNDSRHLIVDLMPGAGVADQDRSHVQARARQRATGRISARSSPSGASSWSYVQLSGVRSVRHLRNCAVCRNRSPSMWS